MQGLKGIRDNWGKRYLVARRLSLGDRQTTENKRQRIDDRRHLRASGPSGVLFWWELDGFLSTLTRSGTAKIVENKEHEADTT